MLHILSVELSTCALSQTPTHPSCELCSQHTCVPILSDGQRSSILVTIFIRSFDRPLFLAHSIARLIPHWFKICIISLKGSSYTGFHMFFAPLTILLLQKPFTVLFGATSSSQLLHSSLLAVSFLSFAMSGF